MGDKTNFNRIMAGLEEAVAFVEDRDGGKARVHIPAEIDVRAIRERLGLTQAAFAKRHGFSLGAVRDWEQGRRVPEAPVRAYLKVIAADPEAVARALETA